MHENQRIAFLGIGHMGSPMCANILNAQYLVTAWNRSAGKTTQVEAQGATIAVDLAAAITGADIIISMLSDGKALNAVITDCAVQNQLKPGAHWIDMSSTTPSEAQCAAEILQLLSVQFVDAPVSGGTQGAQNANLAIMVGCASTNFDTIHPVLSTMGRPVRVGDVGTGQLAKLANQLIVGNTIAAVAEANLLLERGGADLSAVRLALQGGFADSIILQQHGLRMSQRNFTPGAFSSLQLKDLENALRLSEKLNISLPTTALNRDRYHRYVHELGGATQDHSGLFEELLDLNQR